MRVRRRPAEPEPTATATALAFHPDCGENVGGWRVCEQLGQGGSASVWRAVDDEGRVAALKISSHGADLLRYEHRVLREMQHPNIVSTFGFVAASPHAALVLEYLPGGDLVALAGSSPQAWLRALHSVWLALCVLHARGYAHCDLKARNVLFAADDGPRLIDFAAARPLDAPLRRGIATAACTPAGDSTPARVADCFAFAALVYELATGRLPYGATGARRPGETPEPAVAVDPPTAPLLEAAVDVLRAGGRCRDGLSAFADDIESALTAYR